MITIVDYGLGNVQAFLEVYKRLNLPARAARTAADLASAERLILPGVGAFDHAMELLDASGMREELTRLVLERQTPLLGVCVGLQMLAEGSDEGRRPGLGWIPGRVRRFPSGGERPLPVPHMGWNDVTPARDEVLFAGLEGEGGEPARFYFLHSYYFECADGAQAAATASYGAAFACAARKGSVSGVQFHPEKSHQAGMMLLKNFAAA